MLIVVPMINLVGDQAAMAEKPRPMRIDTRTNPVPRAIDFLWERSRQRPQQ